jgi:hypothetical protein
MPATGEAEKCANASVLVQIDECFKKPGPNGVRDRHAAAFGIRQAEMEGEVTSILLMIASAIAQLLIKAVNVAG